MNLAARDDGADLPEGAGIGEGVAAHGDEVGVVAQATSDQSQRRFVTGASP